MMRTSPAGRGGPGDRGREPRGGGEPGATYVTTWPTALASKTMSATAGGYLGFFGGRPPGRFSCRGGVTGFCQPPPPFRTSSPSRGARGGGGGGGGVRRLSAIALLLR